MDSLTSSLSKVELQTRRRQASTAAIGHLSTSAGAQTRFLSLSCWASECSVIFSRCRHVRAWSFGQSKERHLELLQSTSPCLPPAFKITQSLDTHSVLHWLVNRSPPISNLSDPWNLGCISDFTRWGAEALSGSSWDVGACKGTRFPGAGPVGSCELPDVGAELSVLWKNSIHS